MKKIIEHTKETYNEFLTRCETKPRSKYSIDNDKNGAVDNSASFAGTETLQEAFNLTREGWSNGIKQLPLNTDATGNRGWIPAYKYAGSRVSVPRYLQGKPNAFIRYESKTSYNLPRLTVYTKLTYSARNKINKALEFSTSLVEIVNKLQANYDVQIIGICDTLITKGIVLNEIVIKPYSKQLVLNNVAAAMHPSFFRRIWFRSLETTSHEQYSYGKTPDPDTVNKAILKNRQYQDAYIITPSLDAIRGSSGSFTIDKCTKDDNLVLL